MYRRSNSVISPLLLCLWWNIFPFLPLFFFLLFRSWISEISISCRGKSIISNHSSFSARLRRLGSTNGKSSAWVGSLGCALRTLGTYPAYQPRYYFTNYRWKWWDKMRRDNNIWPASIIITSNITPLQIIFHGTQGEEATRFNLCN